MARTKPRGKGSNGQGMNWLRPEKRLAIYLRDGLACAWCGSAVESGVTLTLDHLRVHSKGGGNHATNLVTACKRCNSSRGTRTVKAFARAVAGYLNHGVKASEILSHVTETALRPLDVNEAKRLIALRGSFSEALKGAR
jgi:hypothetical protein